MWPPGAFEAIAATGSGMRSPERTGSKVGDEWAEDDGVDALADREHGCDAGQERGRSELGMDQRRLRSPRRHDGVGEAAAEPPDERGRGVGVGGAGVDGRVRETVVVGGSVQVSDVLLGEEEGGMW